MAEITAIYNFLNDPQHPYHVILHHLKEDVKLVPHKEELLGIVVHRALADINEHCYVFPKEKHALYRCIVTCMYLADDGDQCNVFKAKHIPIKEVKSLLKKLPIIPLFMDTKTDVP